MALLDFLNRRNRNASAEMSFIDHLEELRWHIIRAVVAVLIGAIIVFIYVREIVDKILLAPAHDGFITYKWLCDAGHFFRLGNSLCMAGTKVSFISTAMNGQFISCISICSLGILAFCSSGAQTQGA